MPYKLVFGQCPRGALFPDAAKQIVQEEDLQGITASKEQESSEPAGQVQITSRKVIWLQSWFQRLTDVVQIYKGFQE